MALVSDNLKNCGIRINAKVCGVNVIGSGVLYTTPDDVTYNYVLTAKHLFQEDSQTPYDENKVGIIEIFCYVEDQFQQLDLIKKASISDKLIEFDADFVVLIVQKDARYKFRNFLVSDSVADGDEEFFSWGVFAALTDELSLFNLDRNDHAAKRFKMHGNYKPDFLPGMSGGGIFFKNKSVLYGVISRYPTEEFQNETIDCSKISFETVNSILRLRGLKEIDTVATPYKREIENNVVDIHQTFINGTFLDLEQARKRLSSDIHDDWFHDPLRYVDLLKQGYLFDQLAPFMADRVYKAQEAEHFYVPKKKFTLRLAMISPFIDRIMYMAAVGVIAEKLDSAMISNVYSARYSRFSEKSLILNGVEQWKKMQYQLWQTANKKDCSDRYIYKCVIEIDLLNFYDNISKKLLHEKVLRVCDTENERNAAMLLRDILRQMSDKDVGLPQNSDASSLLASFYLNQVDIFMQHHAPEYYRFMDDIRILCKDKFEARKILQTFEFELRRCYLSVNSQKTQIITIVDDANKKLKAGQQRRDYFETSFDINMARISRYRISQKRQYRNEAFHAAIKLLKENIGVDNNDDASKKVNYGFNTINYLAIKGVRLDRSTPDFYEQVIKATKNLINKPWLTTEVCKVLNLLSTDDFERDILPDIKNFVTKTKYNTYAFQSYQLWLLLAKHKCNDEHLKSYAVKQIEKNDDTSTASIAGMIIYMCAVNKDYRRVILRKLGQKFTHGYFQNRIALVSLRNFRTDLINDSCLINETLTQAHSYSYEFKDKDLVFVRGFDEYMNSEDDNPEEQKYSI
ncbi:hypothetical protein QFZ37_003598 [Chryseobacterium ginsenosidimutans]|uniref:RNA-directed DNA polymerase n=1 Tax=Chryseobacterium ginsenosidimutans TaxID=687846 RepID=UPI00277FFDF9|nr:RNA-directed DNA polymerase [Chryseobacterium ginsenosidimutans]MDQ0595229.1 hypothetical protein [Chryseobacterium ginsenosidimutans]